MGLHLPADYASAIKLLKENYKSLCQYKDNAQIQNQIKERNKGSIKNLLESIKNSIYVGIPVYKFDKEDTYKNFQAIINGYVSVNDVDVDMIITNLKTYEMFNLLDELAVVLEQNGANESASK